MLNVFLSLDIMIQFNWIIIFKGKFSVHIYQTVKTLTDMPVLLHCDWYNDMPQPSHFITVLSQCSVKYTVKKLKMLLNEEALVISFNSKTNYAS